MTVLMVLVLAAVAAMFVLGVVHRQRFWPSYPDDGGGPDGDDLTGVREPRRPLPSGSAATALALPEPPPQDLTARAREIEEP